jgi:hypothetical protein
MAEIKSTLEMVMARAARMADRAGNISQSSSLEEKGMRLAAQFLGGSLPDLNQALDQQNPAELVEVKKGVTKALLRNIILPRDEFLLASSKNALQGIKDMEPSSAELADICSEIMQILDQYGQHKAQIKQQLEDSIRSQLEQKFGPQATNMSLNPNIHPKYQEEWSRMKGELNEQYNQALDQRKAMISQRIG